MPDNPFFTTAGFGATSVVTSPSGTEFIVNTESVEGEHGHSGHRRPDLADGRSLAIPGGQPDGRRAPNPVELILAALGASQEIACRVLADRMGIDLAGVSVTVSGDVDLLGLFEPGHPRPGLRGVRISIRPDSAAPQEDLKRLFIEVATLCPVLNLFTYGTTVSMNIERRDGAPTTGATSEAEPALELPELTCQ